MKRYTTLLWLTIVVVVGALFLDRYEVVEVVPQLSLPEEGLPKGLLVLALVAEGTAFFILFIWIVGRVADAFHFRVRN